MSPRFDYGWVVLSACLIIGIVSFGTQYSFGVFFKSLEAEFGWSRASTSAIFSVFMLLTPVFGISGGWLLDRCGPRMVVAVTGVFTGLGLLLTSMVSTPWHVFLTYSLLIAMGTGPHFPVLMSTVSRWFIRRRGLALGIVTASVGIGMTVMSPVAAYLIAGYGWRVSYLAMSGIAFLSIIPLAFLIKRAPAEIAARHQHLKSESVPGVVSSQDYTLRQALRHRNLWLIMFMWFFCAGVLGLIATHIISHAIDIGITPTSAALIMSIMGGMSIAGKLVMGRASDNIGRKRVLIISGAIMALGMSWLMFASSLWMLYLFAVIYGFAYGGYASPSTALIGDTFGIRNLGLIMAVIDAGWGTGSAVGPALAGYLFDISGKYVTAFIAGLIGAFFSMLLALFLKPPKPRVVGLS